MRESKQFQEVNQLPDKNQLFFQDQKIHIYHHPQFIIGKYFQQTISKFGGQTVTDITKQTTIVITKIDLTQTLLHQCFLYSIPIVKTSWIIDCHIHMKKVPFDFYYSNHQLLPLIKVQHPPTESTVINTHTHQLSNAISKDIIIKVYFQQNISISIKKGLIKLLQSKNLQKKKYQILEHIIQSNILVTDRKQQINDIKLYAILKGINIISDQQIFWKAFTSQQYCKLNYQIVKKIFLRSTFNLKQLSQQDALIWKQIIIELGGSVNNQGKIVSYAKHYWKDQHYTLPRLRRSIIKKCNLLLINQ